MKKVIVHIPDKEYKNFVKMVSSLCHVQKIETVPSPSKNRIVNNLKRGFAEMQLIKEGKIKTTSLDDFLSGI